MFVSADLSLGFDHMWYACLFICTMAANENNIISEILKTLDFGKFFEYVYWNIFSLNQVLFLATFKTCLLIIVYAEELILAFCLSMLVGLLIGILIFILLTWVSRRRVSVRISTSPNQSSGAAGLRNLHGQLGIYRSNGFDLNSDGTSRAVLNLQRQTSVDPNEVLGRSPSFQASTFRPVRKKGSDEKDENQKALLHDTTGTDSVTDPYNMGQSESFWLGKGSLRGFLPSQTPPPAYNSVIHIFKKNWFQLISNVCMYTGVILCVHFHADVNPHLAG